MASKGLGAAFLALAVLATGAGQSLAEALTPLESQGRDIFFGGRGADGKPLWAKIGPAGSKMPASAVPCANCHGPDGAGRPEGGVEPPAITWATLTKPYGHRHRDRAHPPFNAESFGRALAEGIDPAGNRLNPVMPRFDLSESDLAALIAYLKRLESDFGPGVSETGIRIGTVLPVTGPAAELGMTAQGLLSAYFDDLNRLGGIHGRKVTLLSVDAGKTPMETVANAQRLVDEGNLLALIGVYAEQAEPAMARLAKKSGIPLVGMFGYFPRGSGIVNPMTFHLFPPLADQARALLDHSAANRPGKHRAILAVDSAVAAEAIGTALARQAERHGWDIDSVVLSDGDGEAAKLAGQIMDDKVDTVFWFAGGRQLAGFAEAAAAKGLSPEILGPGYLADKTLFAARMKHGFALSLVYPASPSDRKPEARSYMDRLMTPLGLTGYHLSVQAQAFAAAEILTEGLRRAGRSLRRETLVNALEGLQGFDTGLLRPVSFGPNRRIATMGAYVVRFEGGEGPAGPEWVALD